MNFQKTRNRRLESRTLVGRFRGGKLTPVLATVVRGNEGGLLSQSVTYELDPIAGRMITPITGGLVSVFTPVQALDALKNPDADFAGLTEVIREKLLSGNPLFVLENESEISKRCGINPRSISGVKKVSEAVRLAHNAAVNYLRTRKYSKATTILAGSTAITPCLISQTVLDRLNGVLDPDDRINGTVHLELPEMRLPIDGIFTHGSPSVAAAGLAGRGVNPSDDVAASTAIGGANPLVPTAAAGLAIAVKGTTVANSRPDLNAIFSGAEAGGVSLSDFYVAERMDSLTRQMRQIVDDNPEYGEEMVLRWAHGLSVDTGKVPFVIFETEQTFGRQIVGATDAAGIQGDVMRSDMMLSINFNVPVPKTELGGIIITFAYIKPDETISSQPHPFLSDVWGLDNFVADELALDPVPVTIRELDSDCTAAQESTVALYTGLNALKQTYVSYGLNRHLDPETVENKTAVWQLDLPLSVTPDTILYPADLDHYPFADQLAEVCTYTVSSNLVLQTPMIIGPTPVEELEVLNDNAVFGEDP